jgi:hypothetical protein
MTPADLLKAKRIAGAGKKVTSGLSAAKEAQVIANMQNAGEMPLVVPNAPAIIKGAKKETRGNYIALPLNIPRARPKDFGEIDEMATRRARQMEGEHVTSGKPKDTDNLAGRSRKESERLQELDYNLRSTKNVPPVEVHEPQIGDIIAGLPGDQTVSDQMLVDVNGIPIGSQQEGGSLYGLGHLYENPDENKFWASNIVPLSNYNNKLADLADIYGPESMYGQHIAMGRMSNNFAQHFADANLKYINNSNTPQYGIQGINKLMQDLYPEFPGVENQAAAFDFFKNNSEARKYFNNRMKVPAITQPLGLPNGLDIEFAITEPLLRNEEINLTGMSVGKMNPYEDLLTNPDHNTYSHGIRGTTKGRTKNLYPFTLQFPDAAEHIASTQPAASFTGTLQKVFPHQRVDQQLMDEMGLYNDLIKFYTGKKKGGLVHMAAGGTPSQQFPLQKTAPAPRKPISALIPLTEAAANVQKAYNEEKGTYGDKGAAMDIFNRGFVTDVLGGGVDLANMPLQGIDWLQSQIPFLSKPASVMDVEGERTPIFPVSTDEPFAGKEAWNKQFQKSGITSKTERPIAEMTTSLLAPFAPVAAGKAAKLAVKGAKAAAPTAGRLAQEFAEKTQFGMPLQMNVVKPKGGNWLAGESEKLTEPFKQTTLNETGFANLAEQQGQEVADRAKAIHEPRIALNKWIDQKLGKYIRNEMATPEDQIRLGIERRAAEAEKLRESHEAKLAKMQAAIDENKAKGKDTTLTERRLAAAKDEMDEEYQIASRGLYHGEMPVEGFEPSLWSYENVADLRKRAGYPAEGMATHPVSKMWERAADLEVNPRSIKSVTEFGKNDLLSNDLNSLADEFQKKRLAENPWLIQLAEKDPNAKIYELMDQYPDANLEFRHMIDEVSNAMSPDSVLPKSLRIAPKDLEKMTVDDVSALAGKISAWRDVQKNKANIELANNPATHVFKEYPPENNPKGVGWRQIKLPEGLPKEEAEKYVRDAMAYEGDLMKHCVGGAGHCEPLLRGEAEIYSLRDAKGEPHVTIETAQGKPWNERSGIFYDNPELEPSWQQFASHMTDSFKAKGLHRPYNYIVDYPAWLKDNKPDLYEKYQGVFKSDPPRILQIKGKNNRKPKDEYIPFIQDFIKSGNWSGVKDAENADFVSVGKDLTAQLKEAGRNVPAYITQEQKDALLQWQLGVGELPEGFAKGGAVSGDDLEARMNKMLAAHHYAKGGAVSSSLEDRMNAMLAAHYAPQKMAEGGSPYNSTPDMADGGAFIQAGQFKIGGRIALIKH